MACGSHCFYTAGSVSSDVHLAAAVLVGVGLLIQNETFGGLVGAARKKYGVAYPNLYAVPGVIMAYGPEEDEKAKKEGGKKRLPISAEDAYAFNCVQRAHQNHLEKLPVALFLLAVNAVFFPLVAAVGGFLWGVGRYGYVKGYAKGPSKRISGIAPVSYIGLIGMLSGAITAGVHLIQHKPAYAL